MRNIISPFHKNMDRRSVRNDSVVSEVTKSGSEIADFVPSEIQDSYHFIDIVFTLRNAVFQAPKCITLNRFIYLIEEESRVDQTECILCLDPRASITSDEQVKAAQLMTEDQVKRYHNTLVLCVGSSSSTILNLPVDPSQTVAKFIDKHLFLETCYGPLNVVYRVFRPESVGSESAREFHLRHLASMNPSLSPRTSLLITDPMFPLRLIPGVGTLEVLKCLAGNVPRLCE